VENNFMMSVISSKYHSTKFISTGTTRTFLEDRAPSGKQLMSLLRDGMNISIRRRTFQELKSEETAEVLTDTGSNASW